MAKLPERRWRNADGWIIRNLREYGNSLVPRRTVRVLKRMFSEESWKETAEDILTAILTEQGKLSDGQRVWLEPSKVRRGDWIARWY